MDSTSKIHLTTWCRDRVSLCNRV